MAMQVAQAQAKSFSFKICKLYFDSKQYLLMKYNEKSEQSA